MDHFGVYGGGTPVNPLGLAFTLLMGLVLLALPRRYASFPILVLVCFMTMGEHLLIANLNFTMVRILLLFGWTRVVIRGELRGLQWNSVDKVLLVWVVLRTLDYTLVWGSSAALINRLGYAYDILGYYFLFRCLLRGPEDVVRAIRYLALFVGPVAALMLLEKLTGQDPFYIFGGVRFSEIRAGVIRCQGPFSHSILAGTFGATTVPLFVGMWKYRRCGMQLAVLAIASCTLITALSGSSGPALAYLSGILGLALWRIRNNMRVLRWGIVAMLCVIQLIMSRPVWYLMGRLTVFSGSTGWFRGFLIDMTVRHFFEWWLIGSNAAPKWHPFLMDVTNQYVAEGLNGGFFVLILFVLILAYSFRAVGRTVHSEQAGVPLQQLAWALGAALFTHAVSFISVSYFDQNVIVYYMLLASIGALSLAPAVAPAASPTAEIAVEPAPLWPLLTRQ